MNTVTGLNVKPLDAALGAEVAGLDLRDPLTADQVAQILDAWHEHIVLVFRDQDLTTADQRRFAMNFGTLHERRRGGTAFAKEKYGLYEGDHDIRDDPTLMLVSNVRVDGKPIGSVAEGDMWLHIDSGYAERPYRYTILHAVKLPSSGGDTLFANMYKAYDALSDDMKIRLKGLTCLQIFDHNSTASRADPDQDLGAVRHARHPVVVRHPNNGRAALYVNPLLTARIEGISRPESDLLLAELCTYTENQKIIYEHVWRPGDLVIWDNWGSAHARTDFPAEQTRLMRRSIVKGQALEAAL